MYQEEEVCSPFALLGSDYFLEYTNHFEEYLTSYVFFYTDETMMISIWMVNALF